VSSIIFKYKWPVNSQTLKTGRFYFFEYRYVEACITKFWARAKMDKREDLTKAVLGRAKNTDDRKTLECAEAFKLAREFQTEVIEIGRICNKHNIRICKCQLGCFS
jgi:hypothetical protein